MRLLNDSRVTRNYDNRFQGELFSFRHILDEEQGSDYRILMLIRRQLSFRIIRINPESVRGLWAAQQEELIFIRNQNTERGSIQNSRPVLRNVINSSCDQPIGYPNYVSPILTSYSSDHSHYSSLVGRDMKVTEMLNSTFRFFSDCIYTCISCNSGFGVPDDVFGRSIPMHNMQTRSDQHPHSSDEGIGLARGHEQSESDPSRSRGAESRARNDSDQNSLKSESSVLSAFRQDVSQTAEIIDDNMVLSNLDGMRRGGPQLVHWEKSEWRDAGGSRSWGSWRPKNGDIGTVVWGWYPCHRQREKRSHIHTPIMLIEIGVEAKRYVPVQKNGIRIIKDPTELTKF